MFSLYKEILPELGGYLTHAGELSRSRLQKFMAHLAAAEADVLAARAEVRRERGGRGRGRRAGGAACTSGQREPTASPNRHLSLSLFLLSSPSPQDAEAFESKRSRRGGGGGPAWASARVDKKRGTEEAARRKAEIDEDDAFAVRGGRRACCARWARWAHAGLQGRLRTLLTSPKRHLAAPQLDMAALALQAESLRAPGHELELLAAVEGEGEEDSEGDGPGALARGL